MYFDYAATTPPHGEVLKTFDAVNRDFWANPHALYRPGVRVHSLLEQARRQVLALLGAGKEFQCIFTSGATESNNMAIHSAARHGRQRGRHIVTSAVEHPSVLEVCRFLEREGFELTMLPVNPSGCVEPEILQQALRRDTILVSLMHINNETGSVNDIAKLGGIIKANSDAIFHVDASQSVGKYAHDLDNGTVDMLAFSAHKFFGLKGSGALVLKKRMELPPFIHGGGQEMGLRSGTADAARAAALAKALRLSLEDQPAVFERVRLYRQTIVAAVETIDGAVLNGSPLNASPFIINFSIEGIRPEPLLQALGEKEIYISTVSACSARRSDESSVIFALTGSHERARSSIRISLSALTTAEEVEVLCTTLGPVIDSLRLQRK